MSKSKEIELIINLDGTVEMEAINFEGKDCHAALNKIRKDLGKLQKSEKKSEYYKQRARGREREKN